MLIGPARAPDEGSASTGQPACSASRSSAAGSAQPSPQMTTPRSVHGRSRTPGAGAAGKAVHGRPSGRPSSGSGQPPPAPPAASGTPGTRGSRSGRLRWTGPGNLSPAPPAAAHARQASDRQ